jgi:hypothetical protein
MDVDNTSLKSRPPPADVVKHNLTKIDVELSRCHQRLEDLKLLRSLEAKSSLRDS